MHDNQVTVYTITEHDVVVLRMLGGRQDWITILDAAGQSG